MSDRPTICAGDLHRIKKVKLLPRDCIGRWSSNPIWLCKPRNAQEASSDISSPAPARLLPRSAFSNLRRGRECPPNLKCCQQLSCSYSTMILTSPRRPRPASWRAEMVAAARLACLSNTSSGYFRSNTITFGLSRPVMCTVMVKVFRSVESPIALVSVTFPSALSVMTRVRSSTRRAEEDEPRLAFG